MQKTLSAFIEANMEQLLREWEAFARVAQPEGVDLDRKELRDWADGLLRAIALEMSNPQSDAELERKTKRLRPTDDPAITRAAEVHAMDRLAQGFNLNQMISEYRSIRTSVSILWQQQTQSNEHQISELVRFDEALDQALAQSVRRYAAVLERARDLFVGAFGHDMRTPLGSILVSAEALLLSPDELGKKHLQSVVRIRNSATRISEMLRDLLDFTQTRLGGQLPISLEHGELGEVLTEVAEELRSIYPDRTIDVQCQPDLTARFDRSRIAQMLSNVLSNAVKHGGEGTPVTVRASKAGAGLIISVHNHGEPIPAALRRTMFEPLVRGARQARTEAKSVEGGLGLGLYIAREIAEAHGGRLLLKSTDQDGTTFEIRLHRRLST